MDDLKAELKKLKVKYISLEKDFKDKEEENRINTTRYDKARENLKESRNECNTLKQEFNNFKGLNNFIEAKKHMGKILADIRESLDALNDNCSTILFNVDLMHKLVETQKVQDVELLTKEEKYTLLEMHCSKLDLLMKNEESQYKRQS